VVAPPAPLQPSWLESTLGNVPVLRRAVPTPPEPILLPGGQRVRAAFTIPGDADMPRAAYRLELIFRRLPSGDTLPVSDAPGGPGRREPLDVGTVVIAPPGWLRAADAAARQPINGRFGDEIELAGAEALEMRPDGVHLELLWRPLRVPSRDYSVFL